MEPSNPDNNKPFIYRFLDSLGVAHLVVPMEHTHSQDEVSGLVSALAGKQATLTFDNDPTSGSNNPVKSGGIFTALAAKLPKLTTFTTGNFPKIKSDGTLEDSGKKASDFASSSHEHSGIANGSGSFEIESNGQINITTPEDGVNFYIGNKNVTLYQDNAVNFRRALKNPDSEPTYDSDNLVTSGGVFQALQNVSSIHDTDAAVSAVDADIFITSEDVDGKIVFGIDASQVELTKSKLPNLNRAVTTPDSTPTANSDNLVTSGGVKTALDYKLGKGYMKFHDVALTSGKFNPISAAAGFDDTDQIECYGLVQNTTGADKSFGELCVSGYQMAGGSTIIPAGAYFTFGVFTVGTPASAAYCRLIAVYSQS